MIYLNNTKFIKLKRVHKMLNVYYYEIAMLNKIMKIFSFLKTRLN